MNDLEAKVNSLLALQSNAINVDGLAALTGWTRQHIYKLTSGGKLPYYKPNGKTIYFKKEEVEAFLLSNRQDSNDEIEAKANDFLTSKSFGS